MFAAEAELAIVYNGEIYNYIELARRSCVARTALHRPRPTPRCSLAAYEHWGPDFLGHLNGMFAFALWDNTGVELFVASDRFGEKPLFLHPPARRRVAFASEMKALFCHPDVAAARERHGRRRVRRRTIYEDSPETICSQALTGSMRAHAMLIVDEFGPVRRQCGGTGRRTTQRSAIRLDREPEVFDEFRALLDAERPHAPASRCPRRNEPVRRPRLVRPRLHARRATRGDATPSCPRTRSRGVSTISTRAIVGRAADRLGRSPAGAGVDAQRVTPDPGGCLADEVAAARTGIRRSRSSRRRSTCSGA